MYEQRRVNDIKWSTKGVNKQEQTIYVGGDRVVKFFKKNI